MEKINNDKSGNYKYDGRYERNEYLSECQWEYQRETATPASWRRVP